MQAAEIDTVIDTRLVVDSFVMPARAAHENNVIGTMNILAACSGPDSPVRKVVFKSSAHYYGAERDDPAFFTEDMERPHPPRTRLENDIIEAERAVASFASRYRDLTVTVLRFVNGIGPNIRTSHLRLFRLPVIPGVLGFDPRYQFIHEEDIVGVLEHALHEDLPGVYNAAGDGVLVLSEIADLLDKPYAPVLPPWGTTAAARALAPFGVRLPEEVQRQLRYGRGVDNRKLKAAGYRYQFTTREAILKLAEYFRVAPLLQGRQGGYRYEREVENFLRYSPSVRNRPARGPENVTPGVRGED